MRRVTDMLRGKATVALTPRYARCKGCDQPLGEHKSRGSNDWRRGPNTRQRAPGEVIAGRNDDGSPNRDGSRCSGTVEGTGRHEPRDGSIW